MDRSNIQQRYIRRIKAIFPASGKAPGKSTPSPNTARRRRTAMSLLVVALLAVSVFAARLGSSFNSQLAPMASPAAIVSSPSLSAGASVNTAQEYAAYGNSTVGGTAPSQPKTDTTQSQTQSKPWDRKIIRTATLQLTVKDVATGVDKVRLLAAQHGGYVFQSDSHQQGEYAVSSITIQVPTQEFDRIMPELRKLDGQVSKITSENVTSSDVTEEYTDLNSQLRNLQATEARLLALQQKAEKLEDILMLDQQLRQLQGDIERIQGRLNFLNDRSDMSSITVSLSPANLPVSLTEPQPAKAWDPGEIALRAWNASLEMLSAVGTVAITVGVFLWWAIPVLLVAFVIMQRNRRSAGEEPASPVGQPQV